MSLCCHRMISYSYQILSIAVLKKIFHNCSHIYKPTSSFEPLVRTNNTSRCLHMGNTMFWNIEVFEKKKIFYETMDPPSQYDQTLPPKITIMTWIFLLESIYTICRCFHKSYSFSWCFFYEEIFKDFTLTVHM